MKIGLVCRHFSATRGGLERDTRILSQALVQRGHDVHVFCNTGEKTTGVNLHHVPIFPFSSPGKNLSFAMMATRCSAQLELDVLQSMERIWSQDIFRLSDSINPVQMMSKYPNALIHAFKAAGPRRQVLTHLERRIFQQGGARFILAISKLVKAQIMAHYQVPEEKITVIYNSVDTETFNPSTASAFRTEVREPFAVDEADMLILFLGNDFKRKGLHLLLEALVKLKEERFTLLVAGNDPPAAYLRFAARNGIGDKVRFIGFHNHPEKLYASSDLFVLPTKEDTFGNVCLEAMACGVPVIATHTAGASEIIDHGINGYVIKTRDAGELADRIKQQLNQKERLAMGAKAAEKAAGFTMERHLDQLFSLYDVVSEAKRRAGQR